MQTSLPSSRPTSRYGGVAIAFHWVVAALIVAAVIAGLAAAGADKAHMQALIEIHKSFGLTALALIVLRILWRLGHLPPPLPERYPRWERGLAHAAHLGLYAVMLLLPLSGYIHDSAWNGGATHPIVWFGLVHIPRLPLIKTLDPATKDRLHDLFGAVHVYLGYLLYGLLALHLVGVLKHHLVDRESAISRMLPGLRLRRAAAS